VFKKMTIVVAASALALIAATNAGRRKQNSNGLTSTRHQSHSTPLGLGAQEINKAHQRALPDRRLSGLTARKETDINQGCRSFGPT